MRAEPRTGERWAREKRAARNSFSVSTEGKTWSEQPSIQPLTWSYLPFVYTRRAQSCPSMRGRGTTPNTDTLRKAFEGSTLADNGMLRRFTFLQRGVLALDFPIRYWRGKPLPFTRVGVRLAVQPGLLIEDRGPSLRLTTRAYDAHVGTSVPSTCQTLVARVSACLAIAALAPSH